VYKQTTVECFCTQTFPVIKITSTREYSGKVETQERFYISSLAANNEFNKYIRSHWGVENNLHWVLDMVFREDEQRKRANHADKNFAILCSDLFCNLFLTTHRINSFFHFPTEKP